MISSELLSLLKTEKLLKLILGYCIERLPDIRTSNVLLCKPLLEKREEHLGKQEH